MFTITQEKQLAKNIKLLEISAPEIAKKVEPGQFVILRLHEKAERIPLTVADWNKEKGTITLVFQMVGKSTIVLGTKKKGDTIMNLVGPLGKPSETKYYGKVVCIGGGVGIAPIYPIARELSRQGNKVTSIIGVRTKELLFFENEIKAVSHKTVITTNDGSVGFKGTVVNALNSLLAKNEKIDCVFAIGPVKMMKAVSELTKSHNIKTFVSLNPIMIDGTGMCGACRVEVGGETKFACTDGPEFDGHKVNYEELLRRQKMFEEQEKEALKIWLQNTRRNKNESV